MTTRPARPAVTLTEVLIAIFIMGIGLMAILSLFPLGAAQMAQALKDQRTAEAVANAAALGRGVIWKQACEDDPNTGPNKFTVTRQVKNTTTNPPSYTSVIYPFANQQFVMALDDPSYVAPPTDPSYASPYAPPYPPPQPGTSPPVAVPGYDSNAPLVPNPNLPNDRFYRPTTFLSAMPTVPNTSPTGASYPVFVDPMGWQANLGNARQLWLPAPQPPIVINNQPMNWRIPRRTLSVRDTSLPASASAPWIPLGSIGTARDSNNNPTPAALALGGVQRVLKQFSLMDDLTFNADGTPALIANQVDRQGRYSWAYLFRRPNNADRTTVDITVVLYSGRSIDVPSQETAYPGVGAVGGNSLVLTYTAAKPAVRRGQWVLDATLWDAAGNLAPQGLFYRVVNVDDSTPGALALELQTPLLGGPSQAVPLPANQTPLRSIVVMENVVEVFNRVNDPHVGPPMPY